MKRSADAGEILQRLLQRYERGTGLRRVIERPMQAFANPDDLRALVENLSEAAREGAIELVWDRDAPHLIEQVILSDPARLYAFTGKLRPQEILAAALGALEGMEVTMEPARGLLRDIEAAWTRGVKLIGIGPDGLDEVKALVRAVDAAFADLGQDVPLRTRSARLLDDSKALERAIPSMLAYLRQAGMIDANLSRDDALKQLGLAKFAQPVLVAGPMVFGGLDVSGWPYAGVPPELVADAQATMAVRSILTVENLESFNRHVRSCRLPDDVVVYTGGFPSAPVLSLLRVLTGKDGSIVHHWGDIDPGGVRIGYHLETSLRVTIIPHLMDVATACNHGRIAEPGQLVPSLPRESSFYGLAKYLREPDALWLEQEVVDPKAVQ
jgi:hypothetical protein